MRESRLPKITLLLLALLAAACAAGLRSGPHVLAADSGAECRRIGAVEGTGVGGTRVTHETQVYWATREALDAAKAMGATHVVLLSEQDGATTVRLSGFGYRCP
jgi:hypothetical protein